MSSFHLIVIILLLSSTTISHTIILKENMMMNVVGLRFSLLSFVCCMPNRICASICNSTHGQKYVCFASNTNKIQKKIINAVLSIKLHHT